ncbi:hypothetical protein CVT24_008701 [Panaeolus cyanescens]|uniref:Uncharacterized protein n=1 Tax=Panaeolus cyanescens TaxID=181874 RepID=A0A409VKJ6_9AGAR|nr:hypothetical protein CVT24_008701 [Panaeolus cyanescens]
MQEEEQLPSPSIEEGPSDILALGFIPRPKSARTPNSLAPQGARPKSLGTAMSSKKSSSPLTPHSRGSPGRGLTVSIQGNMTSYDSIKSAPVRNTRPLPNVPVPVPPMPTDFVFPAPNTAPATTAGGASNSTQGSHSGPSSPRGTPSQPRKIRRLPKPPTNLHTPAPSVSSDMSGPPPSEASSSAISETSKERKPLPPPIQPSSPVDNTRLHSRISRHIPTKSLPSLTHPDAEANALLSRSSTPPPRLPVSLIPIEPLRPKSKMFSRLMNAALRIPPYPRGSTLVTGKADGDGVSAQSPPIPPTPPSPMQPRARPNYGAIMARRRAGAPLPLKHARSTLLLRQPIRFSAANDDDDEDDDEEGEEENEDEDEDSWSDESEGSDFLEDLDREMGAATIVKALPAFKASVTSLALLPGQTGAADLRQSLMHARQQSMAMAMTRAMGPVVSVPPSRVPSSGQISSAGEDAGADVKPPSAKKYKNVNTVNLNMEVNVRDEGEVDYAWILAERKLIRQTVRNSGKWVWEKKGKRYTQKDYDQVMRVLRAL